ncbi:hypothetical protein F4604DRAFT_954451 [Suillus subluteus]|nr:hypothetical protein F4604DRAFT_954451 [Suillus subluteus]
MHGEEANGDGDGDGLGRKGGHNLAVALAEKDQIVPAEIERRYLTGELQPSARWVGRARSPLSSGDGSGSPLVAAIPLFQFDKVDEEGDGAGEAKGELEVMFYPELDHATVFHTRGRRSILDNLGRHSGGFADILPFCHYIRNAI